MRTSNDRGKFGSFEDPDKAMNTGASGDSADYSCYDGSMGLTVDSVVSRG